MEWWLEIISLIDCYALQGSWLASKEVCRMRERGMFLLWMLMLLVCGWVCACMSV